MGKPIARVKDSVFCESDAHGQVIVPVTGFIEVGSINTSVNDQGAAIADPTFKSRHAQCSGPNLFHIQQGSSTVFVNDRPIARSGDPTEHCGSLMPGGTLGSILPVASINSYAG